MKIEEAYAYNQIAKAIEFIKVNQKQQPNLQQVAESVNLSPFHFQRLFTQWTGLSPKKYLQYLTINYAKDLLRDCQLNLFDTAYQLGLSGTGRLHDLFISIEAMTPAEYKNGGQNLDISYSFTSSPFGEVCVASTSIGICHLGFVTNIDNRIDDLKHNFPNANLLEEKLPIHALTLQVFNYNLSSPSKIKLHVKGTPFQIKIWESLLKIPFGQITTYGQLANRIDNIKASRAVGSAIGSNPVAFLIPCHRVIQSSGGLGGYRWSETRKIAMLGWEGTQIHNQNEII